MATFDITSKIDLQTLDNAVNTIKKEIQNRFDFKNNHVEIDLNKKDFKIDIEVESEMKMDQVTDVIISRSNKQGIPPEAFDFSKASQQSGKILKKEVIVRNGINQEDAKKIVKAIKDSGLKVQAAIMDDMIRVTGKKIDDLQDVIAMCNNGNFGLALQYVNMKS